jgi:hypothetical protein
LSRDVGGTCDELRIRGAVNGGLCEVDGSCAIERKVDRRSKSVQCTSGTDVGFAVAEDGVCKLSRVSKVERSEQPKGISVAWGCGIVDTQLRSLNICHPVQACPITAINRCCSTMSDTDGLSVLLCSSRNLGDSSVATGVTAPLEDSSLIVDDVDVDVLAQRHHTCSGVDRVLILVDEDGVV